MQPGNLYSCTLKKSKIKSNYYNYYKHFNLYQPNREYMSCNTYMYILNTQTGSTCTVTSQY